MLEQNDINSIFDYTPETTESGTGAEPTTTETTTPDTPSAETQGISGEGAEGTGEANNQTEETVPDASGNEHPAQSESDNRRFAAARRRAEAERDRAIAEERANSERYINDAIAALGITDPATGTPVTTKAQYDAMRQAQAQNAKQSFMQANNMTEADYNALVGTLPEVQAARKALAEAEQAARKSNEAAAKIKIDEQIKEISKMDPAVKSIDDIMAMENYQEFYDLVKKGNSFTDAYKLANYSRLVERAAAAEKQRTLNAQAGKAHLTPQNAGQGQGLPTVPAEEMEYYKMLCPDMTPEEIARDWAKRKIK